MFNSIAWRLRTGDFDEYLYRLQVNNVSIKSEKKLHNIMLNWRVSAEAWSNSNKKDYVFAREFKSEQDWIEWAQDYPYELKEISAISDRVKPIKLGKAFKKKRGRPVGTVKKKKVEKKKKRKKRVVYCIKCGEEGHMRKTCPYKNKCSVCKQYGCNSRNHKKEKNDI